ncbi:MAG: cell division protein FtsZ [Bacteroidales bacterium]|nr:cell division protein FtsZ [Bacteroidales bacterium]MBQ5891006.1 cell division protein FtsZ [Bacteroidales bacterium]
MEELMQFESEINETNLLKMDAPKEQSSYIKVLGVGGAGTNAVNHMFRSGIKGVDFIVCNTDQKSLDESPVSNKIKIGEGGLGAGNAPEVARLAAEAAEKEIKSYLEHNTRMLFVTAGMGGGTGTGASPVIARFAKEVKLDSTEEQILVVGVVTLPFSFEGRKRKTQAQEGIKRLKEEVDAVITINTDKLREYGNFTMTKAFSMADDILLTAAKGISEMMTGIGRVHVDFRDVQSVMQNSGVALMGTGIAEGENRALEAIQAATTSKLLNDNDISATKQILLYFVSSEENEVRMEEIDTITSYLEEVTNNEVDYIWGTGIDDTLDDKLSITLVATGFESKEIYTPTQRTTTISITPPISTQQPTEIPVAQVAPQEPYIKSTETETSIEDTKKDTTSIVDEGKEEKIVISVNEFGQPIKKNPSTTSVETETKFTGIIQEPQIAVITKQEDTTKNETPVVTPPPTTNMNDLWGVNTMQNVTAEERMIRIQKIKKMMETEEGINQLASFSPIQLMNSNQEYSQTNNTSNYSINKEGQLVLMKNPALNAQVD